jgi:ABC transport system ATP-binding/permease protein
MAALITAENLRQTFGSRTLFEGVQFSINDGDRLGMIGPNGSGKSTLLKVLAGLETPSDGLRTVRKNLRIGYLSQADAFDPGDTVRSAVQRAAEHLPLDPHERSTLAEIQIGRLEFPDPDQRAVDLSGGWRKRLSIACTLAGQPDLLLLDEPTNHLDIEGIAWLEKTLLASGLAFLVISHDRYLLEQICNQVIELNGMFPQGSFRVDGNYSKFLEKRAEFLDGQLRQQQTLANKVRREVEWLRRGPKARTTKAQARIDRAGQLIDSLAESKSRQAENKRVAIDFTSSQRRSNKLIQLRGVSKSMGGKPLFAGLDLFLERGERLGLLGANGTGKSTLLKLITAQTDPDEGSVVVGEGIKVALFDQNRAQLDLSQPLRTALAPTGDHIVFQGKPLHIEAWSKRFLFRSEQLDLPLSSLSGGEQARVLLARMMLTPADVLLLDEPTNDLDIPSLDVLESSLLEFPGAVVLITHDRYLLEQVSTSILGLDGGGSFGFYPDFDRWTQAKESAARAPRVEKSATKVAPTASKPANKGKGLSFKEKQELVGIEPAIHQAEAEASQIQASLSDPAIMADHVRLHEQCEALEIVQAKISQLFARWEELEAKQNPSD